MCKPNDDIDLHFRPCVMHFSAGVVDSVDPFFMSGANDGNSASGTGDASDFGLNDLNDLSGVRLL